MMKPSEIADRVMPVFRESDGDLDQTTQSVDEVAELDLKPAPPLAKTLRPHIAAGVPVVAFTGPNGAGKTLLAVDCAVRDMSRGRPVYSTVEISSPYGDAIPIRSLRQLLELRDATVLLDEVSVIFSSTVSTSSLPPEIEILLETMRHRGLTVYWTAPTWMRANNRLRAATQGLVNVYPLAKKANGDSPWKIPRIVMAGLMDTSVGKVDETPTKVLRRRMYIPSRLAGWGAYDTLADTPHVGTRKHARVCSDCGGALPALKHSPALHEALGLPWYDE